MQDQRSRLDLKRAEMQSSLEQATAAALEYRQVAEALKVKVDNSRQGWEQATNELKRQLEGVWNEVTGLISDRAQLDKSVEELKSLEGKVLNCDRVTTNMAEEIRRIGLNFGDAGILRRWRLVCRIILKCPTATRLNTLAQWKRLLRVTHTLHLGSMRGTTGTSRLRSPIRWSAPTIGASTRS